jgi:uncharacterized protein YbaP (TraB family)
MNKRFLRVSVALAFTFIAVRGLYAAEPAATSKRVFMWRIKSTNSTVYLLGSIHVAKPKMYPLDPRIEKAFSNSNVLVVEADASPDKALGLAMQMMAHASYPPGDGLDKHISKELFDTIQTRMATNGIPPEMVKGLKPWFIATTLTIGELSDLGIDPQLGIDLHFLGEAKGKPIVELEGAEAQFTLLDGFTDKEQEEFLKFTLKDDENLAKSVDDIITAWSAGDAKKLDDLIMQSVKDSPGMQALYAKLFDDRNQKMAAKIEDMMKTGKTYFVVVGAGHLVGKTGLLQLLGKNHPVEQM